MPANCLRPRPLGSSGLEVSALSLGSWRTYERLPIETGAAILRAAREEGINFFDDARYDDETGTAPIPTGYSEVLFGKLMRGAGVPRTTWWSPTSCGGSSGRSKTPRQNSRLPAADGFGPRRPDLCHTTAARACRRRRGRRRGRPHRGREGPCLGTGQLAGRSVRRGGGSPRAWVSPRPAPLSCPTVWSGGRRSKTTP